MSIELTFMEIAKRHNQRFGTDYPTKLSDIELFFYSSDQSREVGKAIMAQHIEQMKCRLMAAPSEGSDKGGEMFFFKFLTGVIVLGVTIASIVRATK